MDFYPLCFSIISCQDQESVLTYFSIPFILSWDSNRLNSSKYLLPDLAITWIVLNLEFSYFLLAHQITFLLVTLFYSQAQTTVSKSACVHTLGRVTLYFTISTHFSQIRDILFYSRLFFSPVGTAALPGREMNRWFNSCHCHYLK